MANNSFKVKKSLNLDPQTGSVVSAEGDIAYNDSTKKIEAHDGSTADSVVQEAKAATLTNKTISGSSNTISNIPAATALTGQVPVANGGTGASTLTSNGILYGNGTSAVSATSAGSQYQVYQAGASGIPTVGALHLDQSAAISGALGAANGGTGQTSLTANNVILGNGTSGVQFVAPGSSGNILTSNGTTWISAASTGAPTQSYELNNLGLAASISTNQLVIAVKQSDGSSDPSAGSPVKISFRSSTQSTGLYNERSITSALSLTLGTTVSLGLATAVSSYVYVYALDNAGAVELFASAHPFWDEGTIQSTSTTGTSNAVLYGANARSNMPIRLIGRVKATWTSGTGWSTITNADLLPFSKTPSLVAKYQSTQTTVNPTIINYDTLVVDPYNCVSTGASWKFTAPVSGYYDVYAQVQFSANSGSFAANTDYIQISTRKNASTNQSFFHRFEATVSSSYPIAISDTIFLNAGDYIDAYNNSFTTANQQISGGTGTNYITIRLVRDF